MFVVCVELQAVPYFWVPNLNDSGKSGRRAHIGKHNKERGAKSCLLVYASKFDLNLSVSYLILLFPFFYLCSGVQLCLGRWG
ncbi:hypothetical protein RDI58_022253 [Solanum bulbocastanum]|uniref:Uncharacterized protein n=1 Tax=Solanum bulbocastanum TaxID=147425 RepID=A0AAN8Y5H0_SOLBU